MNKKDNNYDSPPNDIRYADDKFIVETISFRDFVQELCGTSIENVYKNYLKNEACDDGKSNLE